MRKLILAVVAASLFSACTDNRDPTGPARKAAPVRSLRDLTNGPAFSDGFEGATFDPYWSVFQNYGAISFTNSPTHGGSQALAFAAQQAPNTSGPNMQLSHQLASPTKGKFSIYFYDAAPGQQTLYEQLSLYNSAQPGLLATIGTNDFDATCYMSRLDDPMSGTVGPNANCGSFPQTQTTNVTRTLGWHLLQIDVGATTVRFSIDGQETFTASGDYAFDSVVISVSGPYWRPTTTGYFDDYSFTPPTTSSGSGGLASLDPANVWLGLKSSDDVGLRVDLRVEVLVSGTVVASADQSNVAAGTSGFNNAQLYSLALALQNAPVNLPAGAQLGFRPSVRRTCSGTGHTSGTVRLWYNGLPVDAGAGRDAGTRFGATINGADATYFARTSSALSQTAGSARTSVDVAVNSSVTCPNRPFQPFGTWSIAVQSGSPPPTPVAFAQITVGLEMACGRTAAGTAYCWGYNEFGQLGDGTTSDRSLPTPVAGGLSFVEIRTGGYHTCGRTSAGTTYCWGANGNGELGNGTTTPSLTPALVGGGQTFVQIALGQEHTCGMTSGGVVSCWGRNDFGQVGDGTNTDQLLPTPVSGALVFANLTVGGVYFSCASTASGAAYCWGWNVGGNLGDGTFVNRSVPTPAASSLSFLELAAGGYATCGRATDGQTYCWGHGDNGEIGNGTFSGTPNPVQVIGGSSFASLSPGGQFACARTTAAATQCWGRNQFGELGDGTTSDRTTPTTVNTSLQFVEVATGIYGACGRRSDGDVFCWGANDRGEVGDGTTVGRTAPVAVQLPTAP